MKVFKNHTVFFEIFNVFVLIFNIYAQNDFTWDDSKSLDWPKECSKISITSSLDGKIQPAYFYRTKGESARPLIVSLHTWSGGYDQKDTLSWMCVEKDYNYIHPHFRGPNRNFEACGSSQVIQDIDDAIQYALDNASIDQNQIHVIGTSGGGYATLLTYMKTKFNVKTFSAWVPISDIVKWYYESEGRGNKYALDIARSTVPGIKFNKDYYYLGKDEAIRRSPFFMNCPVESRKNSHLYIYAGIHDGYTGSVPITQSILFYNKIVMAFDPSASEFLVPTEDIIEMVTSRGYINPDKQKIGDRTIHYLKQFANLARLIIFEGGHEMLPSIALGHVTAK
jgi:hypothetical protein